MPEIAGKSCFSPKQVSYISGNILVKIQKSGWNSRKLKLALETSFRSRMTTYNYVECPLPEKRMVRSFVLAFLRIFPPAHKSEEEK
ncbi:hypothetical protein ACSAZK_06950 [Methanosarcina sp. Mfa9]|uniref:hypothetical protein n=1 Tax=Methanosarcina sp. Mfa9 TaxID=3439063 RepID=UPI003F82FBFB